MTTDYVCPNGHVFPGALTVPCEECGAAVVCEPIAAGMRLHEALEAAETEAADYKDRWEILGRVSKRMTERLEADLARVRGQRDALIEHEAVMTAELVRVRESRDAWRLQAMREHDEHDGQ